MTPTTRAGRFWLRHTELVARAIEHLDRTLGATRGEPLGQVRLAQAAGRLAAHGVGVAIRRKSQPDWLGKEVLALRLALRTERGGRTAHDLVLRWKEGRGQAALEWGSAGQRPGEAGRAEEQWCDPTGQQPDVWLGVNSGPGPVVPTAQWALPRLNGLREIAARLRPAGKPEAALANQLRLNEIETVAETMAEILRRLGACPIENGICSLAEQVAKVGWRLGLEYGADDQLQRIDIGCDVHGGTWPDGVGRSDGPDSEAEPARTAMGIRLKPEPINLETAGHAETCLGYLAERQEPEGDRLKLVRTLAAIAKHPEVRTRRAALAAVTRDESPAAGVRIHGGSGTLAA